MECSKKKKELKIIIEMSFSLFSCLFESFFDRNLRFAGGPRNSFLEAYECGAQNSNSSIFAPLRDVIQSTVEWNNEKKTVN